MLVERRAWTGEDPVAPLCDSLLARLLRCLRQRIRCEDILDLLD